MLDKVYSFIKKGQNRDFFSIEELNEFLIKNNYEQYIETDNIITILPDGSAIYVDDPLFFYDLIKYGYNDGLNLTLIEWEETTLILDEVKPAAYILEQSGYRYKSKELAITVEKSPNGYFKRRIRINGKKVSISTLVKSTEA